MLDPNIEPNPNFNPEEKSSTSNTISQNLPNTKIHSGLPQSTMASEISEENKARWYVLRVQTSKEDKVKSNLEARIATMGMGDRIFRVLVPTEKVIDPKKSKRVSYHKMYPGYVMVEMIKTEQTHYMVKTTPGVGDFAGIMSDAEVERMLLTCEHSKEKPHQHKAPSFYKGQKVRIKEGVFENFEGIVDEVDEVRFVLKVNVKTFDRYTQVELEYNQVQDIGNSTTT